MLGERLRAAFGDHPLVADIRGRGMFYGMELRCSRDELVAAAMARDLWIYPGGSGPMPEAVLVAPPFVITEPELDDLVGRLSGAFAEVEVVDD